MSVNNIFYFCVSLVYIVIQHVINTVKPLEFGMYEASPNLNTIIF